MKDLPFAASLFVNSIFLHDTPRVQFRAFEYNERVRSSVLQVVQTWTDSSKPVEAGTTLQVI